MCESNTFYRKEYYYTDACMTFCNWPSSIRGHRGFSTPQIEQISRTCLFRKLSYQCRKSNYNYFLFSHLFVSETCRDLHLDKFRIVYLVMLSTKLRNEDAKSVMLWNQISKLPISFLINKKNHNFLFYRLPRSWNLGKA